MERGKGSEIFDRLEQSDNADERAFAEYVKQLEQHINEASYGHTIAEAERGVFTEYGYLTKTGDFRAVYRGTDDIPQGQLLFSYSHMPKTSDVENPSCLQEFTL
jgi:hypothetical protein